MDYEKLIDCLIAAKNDAGTMLAAIGAMPVRLGYVLENPDMPGMYLADTAEPGCAWLPEARVFENDEGLPVVRNGLGNLFIVKSLPMARMERRANRYNAVIALLDAVEAHRAAEKEEV